MKTTWDIVCVCVCVWRTVNEDNMGYKVKQCNRLINHSTQNAQRSSMGHLVFRSQAMLHYKTVQHLRGNKKEKKIHKVLCQKVLKQNKLFFYFIICHKSLLWHRSNCGHSNYNYCGQQDRGPPPPKQKFTQQDPFKSIPFQPMPSAMDFNSTSSSFLSTDLRQRVRYNHLALAILV